MDDKIKDRVKLQEILIEISNLKKYANELSDSTRGERLERYINALTKNINRLNDQTEKVYDERYKTIE